MPINPAPLKTFYKYELSDLMEGDEIQVEEKKQEMPAFCHSYRGFITSISNTGLVMEVSKVFDPNDGERIIAPDYSSELLQCEAANIKMVCRGTDEF